MSSCPGVLRQQASVTRLPRRELEHPGDQDHQTACNRDSARQRMRFHRNAGERNTQCKNSHSNHRPYEEVP